MSYEELKEALMQFFGDTSRSVDETASDLRALKDEIDMLLESMQ